MCLLMRQVVFVSYYSQYQENSMGSLIATNQIAISVHSPSTKLYDFHKPTGHQMKHSLSFPSFLKQTQDNTIEYAQRCNYNDRLFQLTFKQQPTAEICIRRLSASKDILWHALTTGEKVPLQEGSILRMADCEFMIKKICQRFSDIDLQDNLKTLSDIDIAENINLGNSCLRAHQSPCRLQLDKSMMKINSSTSLEGEGEFCRVCFGRQGGERNPLLNLCKCAGSVKHIHYQCLKRWVSTKSKHLSGGAYEYYQYDLSCDLCKQRIDKVIIHKGKRYPVYSESFLHPPYVVMAHRNDSSNQVKEFIINFDHQSTITVGKGKSCDLPLNERLISGQHCELTYEKSTLYLRNLNPTFGTFVKFREATISSSDNSISLMINNQLVKLQNESSFNCFTNDTIRIRLQETDDEE